MKLKYKKSALYNTSNVTSKFQDDIKSNYLACYTKPHEANVSMNSKSDN